jgi:PAS domain S-box-containing protein
MDLKNLNEIMILVVEDSPTQAAKLQYLLERSNYKVIVAGDGEQALKAISIERPTLILSDVVMPHLNGYELCQKIKADVSLADIPVILLTSLSDPEEVVQGLSSGADSFITKPYNDEFLLNSIEKILSEKAFPEPADEIMNLDISFGGKKRLLRIGSDKVVNFLLNTYQAAINKNSELTQTQEELRFLNGRLESLVEERTADLTEEIRLSKELAVRLRESEEKFRKSSFYSRNLLEASLDPFVTISAEGKITDVNKATEQITGVERNRLIGSDFADYFTEPEKARAGYEQVFSEGIVKDYPLTIRNMSGNNRDVLYNASLYRDEADVILGVIAAARDITDRNKALKDLQESESKLVSAMENSGDAIFIVNEQGKYIYTNKAVTSLLGFSSEEMKSKTIVDVTPSNKVNYSLNLFKQIQEHGKAFAEIELLKNDGTYISSDLNAVLLPGGHVLASCRDITKRKLEEEALIHAIEKAEASDKLKTTFLNNISHEVRTPLNGILGFAEILFGTDLTEQERKDSVGMLRESSDRLLNTITNYMDISLVTSGNLTIQKKNFIPTQLLNQVFEKYNPKCLDKNLELFLEIPEQSDHLSINSDPEVLHKILSHLLSNAVSFTEKGTIHFGYSINESELRFFVKDTGIGISEDSIISIFNNFVKESRDPSRFSEGSGLGLSIAKGMIEALGGTICVESKVGVGSGFFFTIPVLEEPAKHFVGSSYRRNKKSLRGGSILIAEDDRTNYLYFKYLLKSIDDLKILHASDGEEAIEMFKNNPGIALILMDIKMPRVNGYEATKQVKLINKEIPIIALTAFAMSGCDGYLSKPVSKKSLMDKMAEFVTV